MKKRFLITTLIIVFILTCLGTTTYPIYANTDEDEQLMIGDASVVNGDSVTLHEPYYDDTDVCFAWETDLSVDYKQYILQISESQDFETYEEIKQDIALGNKAQLTLSGGIYYARIRAHGEIYFAEDWIVPYTTQWSNVVEFSAPIDGAGIVPGDSVTLDEPSMGPSSIDLSWETDLSADYKQYVIQISKSQDFETYEEIKQDVALGNSMQLTLDEEGIYYVRIRAHGEIFFAEDWIVPYTTPWSNIVTFVIPLDGETIVKGDSVTLYAPQQGDPTIVLSWEGNLHTDYTQYIIQISKTSDFETYEEIRRDFDLGNSVELTLDGNVYYARIRAHGEIYFAEDWIVPYTTLWSNVVKFKVTPHNIRFTSGGVNDKYIKLTWENGSDSEYEIQYSYDKEFKTNVRSYCFKNDGTESVNIPNDLTRGIKYYFRIRNYKSVDGIETYTAWSNSITLTYQLEKPYIKNIAINGNSVTINWKQVNNCTSYALWCSSDPEFDVWQSYLLAETADKSSTTINDLPSGKYYFKICAVNEVIDGKSGASEWSNAKSVDFKLQKTYLTNQFATNNSLKVIWKTVNYCDGYEIQYSLNSNFENAKTIKVSGSQTSELYIEDGLVPGQYYLRVRTYNTCTNIGLEYSPEVYYSDWSNAKTTTFKLTKTYITNQYIAQEKATVRWKPVKNCTGYQIEYGTDPEFKSNSKIITIDGAYSDSCKKIDVAVGTTYFRIRTVYISEGSTIVYYSDWSNPKSITYVITEPVIKEVDIKYNKLYCKWQGNSYFDGYIIEYVGSNVGKQEPHVVYGSNVSECAINVVPDLYSVRVKGYKTVDGIKYYSAWSNMRSAHYTVSTTQFKSIVVDNDKLIVSWLRSSGCHGYQIEYSTSKEFDTNVTTKTIWNTDSVNYTFDGIKAGSYYVRVRPYKDVNGQRYYASWTLSDSITIK